GEGCLAHPRAGLRGERAGRAAGRATDRRLHLQGRSPDRLPGRPRSRPQRSPRVRARAGPSGPDRPARSLLRQLPAVPDLRRGPAPALRQLRARRVLRREPTAPPGPGWRTVQSHGPLRLAPRAGDRGRAMSARSLAWPALAGQPPATLLAYERGVWGKAHGAT